MGFPRDFEESAAETAFPLLPRPKASPLRFLPPQKTNSSLRVSLECLKWDMIRCLLTSSFPGLRSGINITATIREKGRYPILQDDALCKV